MEDHFRRDFSIDLSFLIYQCATERAMFLNCCGVLMFLSLHASIAWVKYCYCLICSLKKREFI